MGRPRRRTSDGLPGRARLVVVGDRAGRVAYGYGKANEVPIAVEKAIKAAKRDLRPIPLRGTSIPHRITGRFGASKIMLMPAPEGTGVIAGAAARTVLELAGVKDVLTKSYGSNSPKNLIKATLNGLESLRTRAQVEELRGVAMDLPPEPEPMPAKSDKSDKAGKAGKPDSDDKAVEEKQAEAPTATAVEEPPAQDAPKSEGEA